MRRGKKKKKTWNVASVNPAIVTCASGFYFLVSFFFSPFTFSFLPSFPLSFSGIVLPPFPILSLPQNVQNWWMGGLPNRAASGSEGI